MTTAMKALVLCVGAAVVWTCHCQDVQKPGAADKCVVLQPSGVRYSLTSAQNMSGHWITELSLEHAASKEDDADAGMGAWVADVQQTTLSCEADRRIVIRATITAPPAKPGPDYDNIPGHGYYKVHTQVATWEDARKTCVMEGAHLIVVDSQAEAKLVQELCASRPGVSDQVYVGMNDIYTEGQFYTIFGVPANVAGFNQWLPNEPSNSGGIEDCVAITHKSMLYNDVPCTYEASYICEQKL